MSKTVNDPGLGVKFDRIATRSINKDGTFNVKRINFSYNFKNTYQVLIRMDWVPFFAFVTIFILGSNLLFASIYFLAEPQDLISMEREGGLSRFFHSLYFSFQTFTTVGYGAVSPKSHTIGIISSIESVYGLISFAFITGLLYGRFSRPNARFQYSQNILIAPHKTGKSLQFRFVNSRSSQIIELEANMILSITKEENGQVRRMFYNLELETKNILFLPLNWTLVHIIDEKSPLHELTKEDFEKGTAEFMILIKGFDDTFSQVVHSRYSYTADEMIWGAKFVKPFYVNEEGETVLDSELIDKYELTGNDAQA